MQNISEIEELIKLISKLPGLGPKSAKRIVLKLINNRDELVKPLAKTLVERAIDSGKNVVTANKALIAEYGNSLFTRAQKRGVSIYYEASVGGGIPVIKAIREGLAGNKIEWIVGIINGTANYKRPGLHPTC